MEFLTLLLDGIYNHCEGPYLDIKFQLLKLFGVFVHKSDQLGRDLFDAVWVEIMPSRQLIKYKSYRGEIIWRYVLFEDIRHGTSIDGQNVVLEFRGREGMGNNPKITSLEVVAEIRKANEQAFYHDLDKTLGT
jgi:hypothetical protein